MHRRNLITIGLFAGVFAAPALPASAAQNAGGTVNIPIFAGDTANITLGSWGSGKAERSTDTVLIGGSSIKVTTQGLYQGARLDFKNPVDLAPAFGNPRTFLRFQMRFSGEGSAQQIYNPATGETRSASGTPFEHMRFLFTMADGSRRELIRQVVAPPSEDQDAWVPVAFPVAALLKSPGAQATTAAAAPTGDAAKVAQIAIFGDKFQEFQVGEISVITDDTAITVAPLDEPTAFINDQIAFAGQAEGGASTLRYSWDFDGDKQEDYVGQTVQHTWRKPGKYVVTLTVSDVDGLKRPASSSITVNVAE